MEHVSSFSGILLFFTDNEPLPKSQCCTGDRCTAENPEVQAELLTGKAHQFLGAAVFPLADVEANTFSSKDCCEE